jgi:hypothetical protein
VKKLFSPENLLLFAALCGALVLFVFPGCDKGLEPIDNPSGFSGTIRFRNWPTPDNVYELRLIAFKEFPRDSSGILQLLLQNKLDVYPPLGSPAFKKFDSSGTRHVDSIQYSFTTQGTTLKVANYEYIVVGWRYSATNLFAWRPAGLVAIAPNSFEPKPLRVLLHKIATNVDIEVDFSNPPPTPWR